MDLFLYNKPPLKTFPFLWSEIWTTSKENFSRAVVVTFENIFLILVFKIIKWTSNCEFIAFFFLFQIYNPTNDLPVRYVPTIDEELSKFDQRMLEGESKNRWRKPLNIKLEIEKLNKSK